VQLLQRDGLLHVMVDGPVAPRRRLVAPPITDYLLSLSPVGIEGLRVYGRRSGQAQPAWSYGQDFLTRRRLVPAAQAQSLRESYRRREEAARAQQRENEERLLVIEYENYRAAESAALLAALPEDRRNALRDQKLTLLRQQERVRRLSEAQQLSEAESLVREDLARKHVAALEKWRVRRMAKQAVLALFTPEETEWNTAAAVAEPAS
jgi:hypothetical protein